MKIKKEPIPLSEHQYALIDQACVGSFLPENAPVISLAPLQYEHQQDLFPQLLLLNLMEPEEKKSIFLQMNQEIQEGYPAPISLFLQSDLDASSIADYLKQQMIVQESGQKQLLRYYDPRVLVQLSWMMPELPFLQPDSPIKHITFYFNNSLYTVEPEPSVKNQSDTARYPLAYVGLINRVLGKLQSQVAIQETIEKSKQIVNLTIKAKQHQLTQQDDLIHFAVQGMLLPEQFDAHPVIQTLFKQVGSQKISYVQVCQELEENDWQAIFNDYRITEEDKKKDIMYG